MRIFFQPSLLDDQNLYNLAESPIFCCGKMLRHWGGRVTLEVRRVLIADGLPISFCPFCGEQIDFVEAN